MIKQKINGRSVNTVSIVCSTADAATLSAILAGESTEWEVTAEGGTTANAVTPNYLAFSVGKKGIGKSNSASVRLPHIKITKTWSDVKTAVVGAFDQDFATAVKCEYCNLFGASSKGA
ncbi:MAG: hypothetical protein U9P71_01085 [Campylobacterota bacterium]|nr:hypothetical protein [Campylobacterota bacterium]